MRCRTRQHHGRLVHSRKRRKRLDEKTTQNLATMKKFIYLCGMMLISMSIMAQDILNSNDYCGYLKKKLQRSFPATSTPLSAGWRYNSTYSDEFSGSSVDRNKWSVKHEQYHPNFGSTGFMDRSENVRVENGKLYFSVTENEDAIVCQHLWENTTTTPALLCGYMDSKFKIQYGYIEVMCYLPSNHHYWPCFWTTGRDNSIPDYDEVDVFERTNDDGTDLPNILRQNCYNGTNTPHRSHLTQILTFDEPVTGRASVFGVEILPEETVFYINGHVTSHVKHHNGWENSWNTFTCTDNEEMIPMKIVLDMAFPPTQEEIPMPHEDSWFEYFRCYKLQRGSIETYHPITFTPSNESTMVYPHVILGGAGCQAAVDIATAVWAEQDIILDKGFELSANTPFSARVISVPNPEHSPLYLQNCP